MRDHNEILDALRDTVLGAIWELEKYGEYEMAAAVTDLLTVADQLLERVDTGGTN